MTDDDTDEKTDALVCSGLRYQWFANYDVTDEYEKHPQWAIDTRITYGYENGTPEAQIFNVDNRRHEWISSDTIAVLDDWL